MGDLSEQEKKRLRMQRFKMDEPVDMSQALKALTEADQKRRERLE